MPAQAAPVKRAPARYLEGDRRRPQLRLYMLIRYEYLEGQVTVHKVPIDDSVCLCARLLKPGLVSKTTLCFYSSFSLAGQEIEIPTEQVYELHGQKTKYGCHEHWVAPFRALDAGVHKQAEVQSYQGRDKHSYDCRQLLGCGGCACPVPAKTVPPEGRGDFPAHAIGWVQKPPTAKRNETAVTTSAFKSFGQAEWLETTAGAPGARVILTETNDLLVEG